MSQDAANAFHSLFSELRRALVLVVFATTLFALPGGRAQNLEVDLNLVIAVDCSYSVDAAEFDLQRQGIADAFRDPEILKAIQDGPNGRIAVTVVQWSSAASQVVAVPWVLVSDAVSANTLAAAVSGMPRATAEGGTSISAAIMAGVSTLQESPYPSLRNVIDIQADGTNNNGPPVTEARDRALSFGIVINGLTILNEVPFLHFYFQNHVVGGTGSFVEIANDYSAYGRAIKLKLLKEIGPPILF